MPGQNENYNPSFDTPLGQVDEVLYRLYKNMYAPTDKSGTYDYRGAYLAGVAPNTGSNPAQFGHFTDQFKKPNYPTFSVESQYAGAYPEKAGRWQGDTFIPAGYKKGTSNVKTKKYAKGTDSVPSMLSPREAVLNRNAAEILGRHNIAALNAHGNMLAKRGVDLASLPSDPTPGPSTENLLGYQMGTPDVMHDDTADLLREADSAFYGGGGAPPPPTPTPTPIPQKYKRGTSKVMMKMYQYGTEDVRRRNAVSRFRTNYSPLTTATQGVRIGGQYGGAGATLAPEDNPAYQTAISKGRPARSGYTMIPTPSGGSISVPVGQTDKYTRLLNKLPSSPTGFERPNAQAAYALGDTGAIPMGNTPFEKSFRMGRLGDGAVNLPPSAGLGYQIGSAIGNFSPVNFGQGLVNAASRIGQGIANVFTGGNTQAAPVPNAIPQSTPIPYQTPPPVAPTPTPTPTIPPVMPQDNPYGFQYGTASVPMPRRYSDYY